ncbi:expressed unknown protein [Seminavis robusta]|uniref:Nucleoside phosphorylase domain-containing protein n=1 Tax=Seminavis robusta TaxID=568900 RepID=A0A9N8H1Z8_9STRA|nr:expressed unknown protein [Seminavis robusta]|eukprot:Sro26_g017740.1 n/a (334) ;mRNA; f:115224-116225
MPPASNETTIDETICIPAQKPTINGPSIHTNVLIKSALPARGIVSSNPLRVERLLRQAEINGVLSHVKVHTDKGWGVKISTATYKGVPIFIAVIPLGSSGAGFAFFEMFAAGAQALVRVGANDATATMREFVIVDSVDNLVGLQYAAGNKNASRNDAFAASAELVGLLNFKASSHGFDSKQMICHNVEDYHAYNFSEFFEQGASIRNQIEERKKSNNASECCWDMETAALFLRALQFGKHAAAVLLPTRSSLEIETSHCNIIFEALLDFTPLAESEEISMQPITEEGARRMSRANRTHSTNDLIGIEEPLFLPEVDVETGNDLFADDEDAPAF